MVKNLPAMQETQFQLGRSPREGNGYPLQYSCLESHGQRSLVGYSPWMGLKELDTTEQLTLTLCIGRRKSLGSLRWFFEMHLSSLGPASCALSSWISSGAPSGVAEGQTTGWGRRGSCLHPKTWQGSPLDCHNVMPWWLRHPLFTNMAGTIFHSHNHPNK